MVSLAAGDFRPVRPDTIRAALPPLDDPAVDIATLAAADPHRGGGPRPQRGEGQVGSPIGPRPAARTTLFHPRATRALGRAALSPYRPLRLPPPALWSGSSALPPSPLERQEKLRSSCARWRPGMRIDVAVIEHPENHFARRRQPPQDLASA